MRDGFAASTINVNSCLHFSRTLTVVHDNILEDLVFPAEIVGKRIRIKLDCSRIIKVHLDKNQQNNVEHKVSTVDQIFWKSINQSMAYSRPRYL